MNQYSFGFGDLMRSRFRHSISLVTTQGCYALLSIQKIQNIITCLFTLGKLYKAVSACRIIYSPPVIDSSA
ncbi:MAG: hypothetical protein RBR63_02010 [Methanosarcina vacuolata]|nr:hypothetical protein [Methanosarcina vacuolata]